LHCYNYTPYSAHVHSYKIGDTFSKIIPKDFYIKEEEIFGSSYLRFFPNFCVMNLWIDC